MALTSQSAASSNTVEKLIFFPFEADPKRIEKWLIGGLIALVAGFVPILPYAVLLGHGARISRDVQAGQAPRLPDWQDLATYLIDGLKIVGVGLVYSLPALVLLFGSYAAMFGSMFLPVIVSGGDPDRLDPAVFGLSLVGGQLVFFGLIGLGIVLMLIGLALAAPAIQHMLATGRFAAAFDLRAWWPLVRRNFGGWLVGFAVLFGVNLVLGMILNVVFFTVVLCALLPFLGPLVQAYLVWVGAALFADAYRVGLERTRAGVA